MDVTHFGPLPISWDGAPVEWGPWEPTPALFICDRSTRNGYVAVPCAGCGRSTQGQPIAWGKRRGIRDLFASRCMGCGHDSVLDKRTGESWELGPEDYGFAGSTPPRA